MKCLLYYYTNTSKGQNERKHISVFKWCHNFVIIRQYLQHISVVQKVCYRVCKGHAHNIAVTFCYIGAETRKWHSKRNCPYPYSIPMNFHISSQLPWFSPFSQLVTITLSPSSSPNSQNFAVSMAGKVIVRVALHSQTLAVIHLRAEGLGEGHEHSLCSHSGVW